MEIQLTEAEAARLKRTSTANPDAEDLALQCEAGVKKGPIVLLGKEAEAVYRLCEQALAIDPDNVRALVWLARKFWRPVAVGLSADPKGDFERADRLLSRALALDPNYAWAHELKGYMLAFQGHLDESVAECERALSLDPSLVQAYGGLGYSYLRMGQFEKSLENYDKAIRLSPRDPSLVAFLGPKADDYFALKQYDQAIEWARRTIAVSPDNLWSYFDLIAALAMAGHEAEAREALQRYLASDPKWPKTIAA
jgi:adenylate cyclase